MLGALSAHNWENGWILLVEDVATGLVGCAQILGQQNEVGLLVNHMAVCRMLDHFALTGVCIAQATCSTIGSYQMYCTFDP